MFTGGSISPYAHYEYYLDGVLSSSEGQSYEDFIEEVNAHIEENGGGTITNSDGTPANAPSGQPLPGLLVTLAIGGSVLACVSKKRRKARA